MHRIIVITLKRVSPHLGTATATPQLLQGFAAFCRHTRCSGPAHTPSYHTHKKSVDNTLQTAAVPFCGRYFSETATAQGSALHLCHSCTTYPPAQSVASTPLAAADAETTFSPCKHSTLCDDKHVLCQVADPKDKPRHAGNPIPCARARLRTRGLWFCAKQLGTHPAANTIADAATHNRLRRTAVLVLFVRHNHTTSRWVNRYWHG